MAGDWIKWGKGLAKKPEVVAMASQLGIDRHHVAGLLMELWEWGDDNIESKGLGQDEWATVRMSPNDGDNSTFLDALVGFCGFADAMAEVGWLTVRSSRIAFPNYARHNGDSAKSRARNCRNQKRKREGVTEVSPANGDSSSLLSSNVSSRSEETNGETSEKLRAKFAYPAEFEAFYKSYPEKGRKGKKAAFERWKQARARLLSMGCDNPVECLQKKVEDFARSPKATGYCWNVTTWLNEGHYEDEPAAWGDSGTNGDPRGTFSAAADYLETMKGKPLGIFG